jgi:hypothetical protein
VKTPRQCLRGAVQESAEAPGRVAAAINAWSVEDLDWALSARQPEDSGSNAFGIEPQSDQTAAAV